MDSTGEEIFIYTTVAKTNGTAVKLANGARGVPTGGSFTFGKFTYTLN